MTIQVACEFVGHILLTLLCPVTFLLDKLTDIIAKKTAKILEENHMVWSECRPNPDSHIRLERDIKLHAESYTLRHKRELRMEINCRLAYHEGGINALKLSAYQFNRKFNQVNARYDWQEIDLTQHDRKIDRTQRLMEELITEVRALTGAVEGLRADIRGLQGRVERLEDRVELLEGRLESVEERLKRLEVMSEADTEYEEESLPSTSQ